MPFLGDLIQGHHQRWVEPAVGLAAAVQCSGVVERAPVSALLPTGADRSERDHGQDSRRESRRSRGAMRSAPLRVIFARFKGPPGEWQGLAGTRASAGVVAACGPYRARTATRAGGWLAWGERPVRGEVR